MKKALPLVLLLALGIGAGLWFKRVRPAADGFDPARLLPATTAALLEIPDPEASAERWRETALAKLWADPELQAFLERPLAQLRGSGELAGALPKIWRLQPRRLFAALLSVGGPRPRWIAGFEFAGTKPQLDDAIADARTALLQWRPVGRADLEQHGRYSIETFTDGTFVLCSAVAGPLYLIANHPDDLRAALDRLGGGAGKEPDLASDPLRVRALARLPKVVEARTFLRTQPLLDRFLPLIAATGKGMDPARIESFRRIELLAATTSFNGRNLRDTVFLGRATGGSAAAPAGKLRQPLRALATPDTLFLFAGSVEWPERVELSGDSADAFGVSAWFRRMLPQLVARGLGTDRLGEALGSEVGLSIDWAAASLQPSVLGSVEIRNATLASGYCEALLANPASGLAVRREQVGPADFYSMAALGHGRLTPAVAVTPDRLLFSLDASRLRTILAAPAPTAGALERSEAFRAATEGVGEVDRAFAYLDLKGLVERAYAIARPLLMFALPLTPGASRYVDPSKLPGTETLSRHLGPVVFTQRTVSDGLLIESSGPLTLNQVAFDDALVGVVSRARDYLRR